MGKFLFITICAAALGLSACGNSAPATDKAATSAVKVDPNIVIKSAQDKRVSKVKLSYSLAFAFILH